MTTEVITYRDAARELLDQAHIELDFGDLRQASEKGWGAAAQMVKAIAEERGWPHTAHRHLWTGVRDLTNETEDPDVDALFASANYLHVNFYENALEGHRVAYHLGRVELFVAKLEEVMDA